MDSREDESHLLALLAVAYVKCKQRRKKREQWCKQWMERRNKSTHINLLNELRDEPSDFSNYLRMNGFISINSPRTSLIRCDIFQHLTIMFV